LQDGFARVVRATVAGAEGNEVFKVGYIFCVSGF